MNVVEQVMSLRYVLLLKLMEDMVKHLDSTGQLPLLENAGLGYKNVLASAKENQECQPPLRFSVNIDMIRLLNESGPWGQLLLSEPLVAKHILQQVVQLSVESLVQLPTLGTNQVQVSVRLLTFPTASVLTRSPQLTGLVLVTGVLVARTATVKYTSSVLYRCPASRCSNHAGVRKLGSTLAAGAQCKLCCSLLEELPRGRDTGDQVFGYLLHPRALQGPRPIPLPPVLVCFQDETADGLQLGDSYAVAGCHDLEQLRAWQVWRLSAANCPASTPLPRSVLLLQHSLTRWCPRSPWALAFSLAAQMASQVYPGDAFMHLKMGLLLSLASQGGATPVAVLAVGSETVAAGRLQELAGCLAERYVPLTSPGLWSGVGAAGRVDEAGRRWSEAGALLLAASGVCALGDWAAVKQPATRDLVLSALESGSVTLDTDRAIVGSCPLRCAVWTYTSTTLDASHLRKLVGLFGVPFLAEADGSTAEQVARHLLRLAAGGGHDDGQEAISHLDLRQVRLKGVQTAVLFALLRRARTESGDSVVVRLGGVQFVQLVKCRPVQLSDAASRLIRNYFVASRRLRPHCLPVGAVNTITRLSEAFARLSLEAEVSRAHVLAVLYLYEDALDAVFGPCLVAPRTPATAYNHLPLHSQVDSKLTDFSEWTDRYISSMLGELEE